MCERCKNKLKATYLRVLSLLTKHLVKPVIKHYGNVKLNILLEFDVLILKDNFFTFYFGNKFDLARSSSLY